MKRFYHKVVSLFSIAAVLFAQLAVSAYACPMLSQILGAQDETLSASSVEPDGAQPNLCQKHCEDEQQNVKDATASLASITFTPASVVSILIVEADYIPASLTSPALLHATSPPIPIRNCCFRI